MLKHEAWRGLSGNAMKVYLELCTRYTVKGDGITNNNGELTLSLDEAARLLKMGKSTAQRALIELEEKGFIKLCKKGHWYGRQASKFAITNQKLNGQPPTKDWQNWGKQ